MTSTLTLVRPGLHWQMLDFSECHCHCVFFEIWCMTQQLDNRHLPMVKHEVDWHHQTNTQETLTSCVMCTTDSNHYRGSGTKNCLLENNVWSHGSRCASIFVDDWNQCVEWLLQRGGSHCWNFSSDASVGYQPISKQMSSFTTWAAWTSSQPESQLLTPYQWPDGSTSDNHCVRPVALPLFGKMRSSHLDDLKHAA